MQTLLNGVTTDTTSATQSIDGLYTIVCNGLKNYKQFVNFFISVDNVNFVLFKTINIEEEAFNINVGPCFLYCRFETELEENDPVFVHIS
jgi:hypothetical protein